MVPEGKEGKEGKDGVRRDAWEERERKGRRKEGEYERGIGESRISVKV